MIEVLINLAAGTVLDEQTTEDPLAAHPQNLPVSVVSTLFPPHSCRPPSTLPTILSVWWFDIRYRDGGSGDGGGTYSGIRASAVPLRLPKPRWRPIRRARLSSRARERECMVTGFLIIKPSATSLRTVWREFAFEISDTSLGSSQIFRWPQPKTAEANRFWVVRLTLHPGNKSAFRLEIRWCGEVRWRRWEGSSWVFHRCISASRF